jgi:hypothetical protein
MAQTGLGKGLAVEHDFGADINRLYQRENMRAQINVEKHRKAQLYGEMMKKPHVRGEYNTKRLETHIQDVNNRLADFVTANPGWETDPGLFAEFSTLTDEYINNDIVREDIQVQKNYEAFQSQASSGKLKSSMIEKNMNEYTNYIEHGNNGHPYLFMNPLEINTTDLLKESQSILAADDYTESYIAPNGLLAYRSISRIPDAAIQTEVNANFKDPDKAQAIMAEYEAVGGKAIAPTAKQYWFDRQQGAASESRRRAGYDEAALAAYKGGLDGNDQSQVPSYYQSDVLDRIDQANANYVKSGDLADMRFTTSARPEYFALTSWEKAGSQVNVKGTEGYRFALSGKEIEEGKISPDKFNFDAEIISVGSGKYVFDNYNSYIEMPVKIPIPISADAMKSGNDGKNLSTLPAADKSFEDDLLAHGFQYREEETFDWGSFGSGKTKKVKYLYGTIQAPAIEDAMTIRKFDGGVLSAREQQDAAASGMYDYSAYKRSQIQDPIEIANTKLPGYNFSRRESDGKVTSADGLYELKPNGDIVPIE